MVTAGEAPLLNAECCTSLDEEGRLDDFDSGKSAAKKDLFVRRLADGSGLYDLSKDVCHNLRVQFDRAFVVNKTQCEIAAVVQNVLRNKELLRYRIALMH